MTVAQVSQLPVETVSGAPDSGSPVRVSQVSAEAMSILDAPPVQVSHAVSEATFTPDITQVRLSQFVIEAICPNFVTITAEQGISWEMRGHVYVGYAAQWNMLLRLSQFNTVAWSMRDLILARRCMSWGQAMPVRQVANPMPLSPVDSGTPITTITNHATLRGGGAYCGD